jgi:RNA polymerase sigma-70 factor, ECF subfamily
LNFESVYRAHYDFIWRMLRRLGVSQRHVEDACQIVFLTAYRRMADFEGRSSVKTWLCAIALRVASDYRRSAAVRHERLIDPASDETSPLGDPQLQLELRERLAELDVILEQLSSDQRTVLVLHEFEQFSGEEIAQLENVPLGTVRSRLRLARQTFSRILLERRGAARKMAAGGDR